MTAIAAADLASEVGHTIRAVLPERHSRTLWQNTNLMIASRGREDQLGILDDVLVMPVEAAENQALVKLSAPLVEGIGRNLDESLADLLVTGGRTPACWTAANNRYPPGGGVAR